MYSQLLGVLDPLFNILKNFFNWILVNVLGWLMDTVITPVIQFLFTLITYVLGIYLYQIAVFILALIDYVEVLFRGLAGLAPKAGATSSATISLGGKTQGDLVLQLIRNEAVQEAFLAMCIVGLFLLLVTSVFQIIKVEYTTEGAKNAKGPILQKAFKGLANLMLLPILCVFGIVFANQLLGLLDKATSSEGSNPTISGLLFVTCASDAHYMDSDKADDGGLLILETADPVTAIVQLIDNLGYILTKSGESVNPSQSGTRYIHETELVETGFLEQKEGYKYYNIQNVTTYYEYSRINYLLLILGGCVILKSLFFACFGMVLRLYKCAVLFIISPVVIGMTPINEGGLDKWRGQFIGQILAAYGTVMSLNLFLIIIRVLLNVQVTFTGTYSLTSGMMTGLLKIIFVIAGCVLIEKFAKDLGSFFGAEDAMSGGKDLAKQVGDTAMAGVKVAGAAGKMAMGGAGLALKGVKAAGGIAGKIGKAGAGFVGSVKGGGVKGGLDYIGGGIKDGAKKVGNKAWSGIKHVGGKAVGVASKFVEGYDSLAETASNAADTQRGKKLKSLQKQQVAAKKRRRDATARYNTAKDGGYDFSATMAKIDMDAATKEEEALRQQINKVGNTQTAGKKYRAKLHSDANAVTDAAGSLIDKDLADKEKNVKDKIGMGVLFAGGFAQESFDQSVSMIPGIKKFRDLKKMGYDGMDKLGDSAQAAAAYMKKQEKKKVEDRWENNPITHGATNILITGGSKVSMDRVAEELHHLSDNSLLDAKKAIEKMAGYYQSAAGDQSKQQDIIMSLHDKLEGLGAGVSQKDVEGFLKAQIDGTLKLDASALKLNIDSQAITDAVQKAMSKGGGYEEIIKEVQKVLNRLGEGGNLNLIKQIEKIIKDVMNDLK